MNRVLWASIPCLFWLGACAPSDRSSTPHGKPSPAEAISPPTPARSPHETADPMMLGEVDNGFRRIPIPLGTDYGFLVLNAGDEDLPKPQVTVGLRSERKILTCDSLAQFEVALHSLPVGAVLHRHDRCLRPAAMGLPQEFLEGIEQTLARTRVQVAPETTITCICGR